MLPRPVHREPTTCLLAGCGVVRAPALRRCFTTTGSPAVLSPAVRKRDRD